MVKSCAAFNCTNRIKKGTNISFYRFPLSKPQLLAKWLIAVRRQDFQPTHNHYLCSEHFEESCFLANYVNCRKLKDDAVPSLFKFPKHIQQKVNIPRTTTTSWKAATATTTAEEIADPPTHPPTTSADNIRNDHNYALQKSPRTLKRQYSDILEKKDCVIRSIRKQLYNKKVKCEKQEQKIKCLSALVTDLKARNLINERTAGLIEETFSDVSLELFRRILSGKNNEYSDRLKSFSLTLYFYSPCAYEYVRNSLNLALPHPNTLRSWYNSVDGKPGFTAEAFSAISERTKDMNGNVYVCLTFDEMSIKKRLDWDGTQFVGYVDRGFGVENEELEEAKEALVLLVVGVNTQWKIPIAYFLVNGMSADEKFGVVQNALRLLHAVKAKCVGLTFDGLSSNLTLASKLGAKLDVNNMQPYFIHPCSSEKVYLVFLDACHMLKLVRNLFSDMKVMIDLHGNFIRWQHIVALEKLQSQEGLVLANRLKRNHVTYHRQKMKVKLAVQVLSSSVCTSLRYLIDDLQLDDFRDAKGTADFCEVFDKLFDICNCKSPFAVGYKSALRQSNKPVWESFLTEAESYLLGLKDSNGKEIYKTQRKTPIIGFMCIIYSIRGLFVDLVETSYLKYLLLYKFSQDHVEMFFCMIRGRFGWNNNPSALQFRSAYRQLLVRNEVKSKGTGNCTTDSVTPLLSWRKDCFNEIWFDPVIFSKSRVNDVEVNLAPHTNQNLNMSDHDYISSNSTLTEYSDNIIVYIAGYVVKHLKEVLMCPICILALFGNNDDLECSKYKFLKRKNNGGLTIPSSSVIIVCAQCEVILRGLQGANGGKPPRGNVQLMVQVKALEKLQELNVFQELEVHALDNVFPENHILLLIKAIVSTFLKIRLHHVANSHNFTLHKEILRQHFTKSVLFLNQ